MGNERVEKADEKLLWNLNINDRSPHGICVIHVLLDEGGAPYDWCFDYCNPALAEAEGFTPEEITGRRYFELHPKSSREWLPYYYKAAYEDTYQAFDVVAKQSGTYLRIEAMPTGKTGYCMCVLYNIQKEIAEKEQQNQELQAMYQRLENEKKVLDQLCTDYTAVYYVDLDTGGFHVWHVAQGCNASEILGRNFESFDQLADAYLDTYFYPGEREKFREWFRVTHLRELLQETTRIVNHYESIPTPAGQQYFEVQVVRVYDEHGEIHALIGFRCIDEIMRRETAVQKELKTALDQAQLRYEIISAIAKAYTTIIRINLTTDTAEEIATEGYTRELMLYEHSASTGLQRVCNQLVDPDYREAASHFMDLSTLAERMETEEILDTEYKMCDGSWHRLSFIVKKRDEAGRVTNVLCAIRSISETKRRELELVYQAAAAKREGEMKARFLANMSHDIRTPLNGVIGLVNLASQYPENLEMLTKIRAKEKENLQYLVSLVSDVLDMNKIESGELEERELNFDVVDALVEINRIAEARAEEKGIHYDVAWKRKDIRHSALRGNPVYLGRILRNVTDNAIKFSEPGTTIRVWAEELGTETISSVPASGMMPGNSSETVKNTAPETVRMRFICQDQGCGMSEEMLQRVGMMFTQGEETSRTQYEGTGLGLAITKKLVERMGGMMHIESEQGVGTRVTIEIPFAIGEESKIHEESQALDKFSLKGLRVLLAEDNALNMEIVTFMLENHGIEVTPAKDGQEAVDIFEKSAPGYFGAIYMDIMMPRMNGLDATRAIRAMKRRDARVIPIIAMSANAFSDDIITSRLAGMNRHLAKPLDEESMILALRQCMSDSNPLKLTEDL